MQDEEKSGGSKKAISGEAPGGNRGSFKGKAKKVGFTVWLAVMVIGGALAFLVALFLV